MGSSRPAPLGLGLRFGGHGVVGNHEDGLVILSQTAGSTAATKQDSEQPTHGSSGRSEAGT